MYFSQPVQFRYTHGSTTSIKIHLLPLTASCLKQTQCIENSFSFKFSSCGVQQTLNSVIAAIVLFYFQKLFTTAKRKEALVLIIFHPQGQLM